MRDSGEGLDETTVTALTVEHWRESTWILWRKSALLTQYICIWIFI